MVFKEFMKENWKKSIIIFLVLCVLTVSSFIGHNLLSGNQGLLFELFSSLFFFLSLIILWPYLVVILVTESPVVWLGITWNNFLVVLSVFATVIYTYILSCALIVLSGWIRK